MKNIVLIGMPGAGKSTVGVILAKALGMDFCDTDIVIQNNENMFLQDIIDKNGIEYFKQCEEKNILTLTCQNTVIATGGSAVYSEKAMMHLKKSGTIVYLSMPAVKLKQRINNFSTRGIIGNGTIDEIFAHRRFLYEKYADITADCENLDIESTVKFIIDRVGEL